MTFNLQINPKKRNKINGYTLAEALVTTAILGTLTSIAYPSFIASKDNSECSEAQAILASIPPIISAFIDSTGETPASWDDLSSIAVVMTNDGPATGDLKTPITLPRTNYELYIEGPNKSTYELTANCYVKKPVSDQTDSNAQTTADLQDEEKLHSPCF